MYSLSALSSLLIVLISFICACKALECYVCDKQDDNYGKCVTTIKTCEYGEDACLTETAWGSTPYWTQGALKQYYISKRCSKSEKCEAYRSTNMPWCTHISYQDWKCSDCCKGDRCNYYIFSGSHMAQSAASIVVLTTIVCLLFKYSY